MAKKKSPQPPRELTPLERLGLRVSAMIQAPKAQIDRRVVIHRIDSDTDEAWDGVMELLAETEGLTLTFNDDGTVTVSWAPGGEPAEAGEERAEEEEEPAPF